MRYAVIMAGGEAGTRLWPMSRQRKTQATPPLHPGIPTAPRSLLQVAAARLRNLVDPANVYVCTSAAYTDQVLADLPLPPPSSSASPWAATPPTPSASPPPSSTKANRALRRAHRGPHHLPHRHFPVRHEQSLRRCRQAPRIPRHLRHHAHLPRHGLWATSSRGPEFPTSPASSKSNRSKKNLTNPLPKNTSPRDNTTGTPACSSESREPSSINSPNTSPPPTPAS